MNTRMPRPRISRSRIIWAVTTSRADSLTAVMSPKPHGAEGRDGEVERIGAGQVVAEAGRAGFRHQEIGGGKQEQEQGRRGGQGPGSPHGRVFSADDRAYLPGRNGQQDHQPDRQQHPQWHAGDAVKRQQVVQGDQHRRPTRASAAAPTRTAGRSPAPNDAAGLVMPAPAAQEGQGPRGPGPTAASGQSTVWWRSGSSDFGD